MTIFRLLLLLISKRRKTICLAGNDVASQFKDFRKCFEKLGFRVITLVVTRPSSKIIDPDKYDFVFSEMRSSPYTKPSVIYDQRVVKIFYHRWVYYFNLFKEKLLFYTLAKTCNIFLYMSITIKENCADLIYFKDKKRKIAYIFNGDDARWYYGMLQDFKLHGLNSYTYGSDYDYSVKGLESRISKIRTVEKYADIIFSKREQSQLQVRGFYHYPMTVKVDDYTPNTIQREIPVIVHAPSSREIKGTLHILSALEKLKEEGLKFELKLLENVDHQRALQIIAESDIVIDQLNIPGAGKLSSEAMALGKVVISKMAYGKYEQGFPIHDCPIIDAGPDDIYLKLKEIIPDVEKRKKLALKGPEYVKNRLSAESFCERVLKLIKKHEPFDYIPTFYKEHYVPESDDARECLEKWDKYFETIY